MISRNVSAIAFAVAAALSASSAMALNQTDTNSAPVKLTIAGASAARDAMLLVVAQELCQAGTVDVYRATPTGGQDFRAYSCTLVANDPAGAVGTVGRVLNDNGAIGGQNATFYYRSEGGSFWGPGSIVARNLDPGFPGIKSLDTTGTCTAVGNTNFTIGATVLSLSTNNCLVSGYTFTTDNFTSGALVDRQTQFGVSDVEPKMFTDTNYPQSSKFPTYTPTFGTALAGLSKDTGFGQSFGVFVNTLPASANTANLTNLTSAQVTAIFSQGGYTNWNKIPGLPGGANSIKKARREPGSGTHAAMAAQFLNVNCGDSYAFVVDNANTVREFSTSGDLNTYVSTTPDAIGYAVYTTSPPANTRFVTINGVSGDRTNVQAGTYDFAYELTTTKATDPTVLVPGSTSENMANALQTILKRLATTPDAPSVFGIPSSLNPVGSTNGNRVTARASRNGNSCLPFQGK